MFCESDVREENAKEARKALDRFRPEIIKKEWKELFSNCGKVTHDISYFEGVDFYPYLL